MMSPAERPAPVFLLAPARSYSTISLALLAGHPDIYGFPEMLLFRYRCVGDLLESTRNRTPLHAARARNHISGVLRAVADIHEHDQSHDSARRAYAWLADRADWPMVRVMDHLLELVSPLTGLEKSPETSFSEQTLRACSAAYPDARFIHLTRHPLTTQRSQRDHMRPYWEGAESELAKVAATRWQLSHVNIMKFLCDLPRDRWVRIRAEDLLTDPAKWLRAITRWLGLPFNAHVLARMRQTSAWRYAGTGPSGGLYGGDHKFMHSPELRPIEAPGPLERDPGLSLGEETWTKMAALAQLLGY